MIKKSIYLLLAVILLAACKNNREGVKPLAIDLPVSYKTDTVAYNFISKEIKAWNEFGQKVEKMYGQAEKFRKKDFDKLSARQEYNLVKLDYEYAVLWVAIDLYVDQMVIRYEDALTKATPQGAGKMVEAQLLIMNYYQSLAAAYEKDLKLDQKAIVVE